MTLAADKLEAAKAAVSAFLEVNSHLLRLRLTTSQEEALGQVEALLPPGDIKDQIRALIKTKWPRARRSTSYFRDRTIIEAVAVAAKHGVFPTRNRQQKKRTESGCSIVASQLRIKETSVEKILQNAPAFNARERPRRKRKRTTSEK
jgi:hypothetical protein